MSKSHLRQPEKTAKRSETNCNVGRLLLSDRVFSYSSAGNPMGVGGSRKSGGWRIWDDKAVLSLESLTKQNKQLASNLFACRSHVFDPSNQMGFNCQGREIVPWIWLPYHGIITSPWWQLKPQSIMAVIVPSTVISCLTLRGPRGQSHHTWAGSIMSTCDPEPNSFKCSDRPTVANHDRRSNVLQLIKTHNQYLKNLTVFCQSWIGFDALAFLFLSALHSMCKC